MYKFHRILNWHLLDCHLLSSRFLASLIDSEKGGNVFL
jgi:hypothetical protein